VADPCSTPAFRPGQPQTNKRKCGIQPAHQSLFTDVFRSRPLLCTIYLYICIQLHGGTRGEELSRALCLTWDNREFLWWDLPAGGVSGGRYGSPASPLLWSRHSQGVLAIAGKVVKSVLEAGVEPRSPVEAVESVVERSNMPSCGAVDISTSWP